MFCNSAKLNQHKPCCFQEQSCVHTSSVPCFSFGQDQPYVQTTFCPETTESQLQWPILYHFKNHLTPYWLKNLDYLRLLINWLLINYFMPLLSPHLFFLLTIMSIVWRSRLSRARISASVTFLQNKDPPIRPATPFQRRCAHTHGTKKRKACIRRTCSSSGNGSSMHTWQ